MKSIVTKVGFFLFHWIFHLLFGQGREKQFLYAVSHGKMKPGSCSH